MYKTSFSIQSNAALYAAIEEGDRVFSQTTHPILPHFAYGCEDATKFIEAGLPCIVAPTTIGECIQEALSVTPKANKSCKTWDLTQHHLIAGIQAAQRENLGHQFHCAFITITSSATMATPETYMRAVISLPHIQNNLEEMMQQIDAIPLVYTSCIETHPGKQRNAKKKGQEEDQGNVPEGIDQAQTEHHTAAAKDEMASGYAAVSKPTLKGNAHIHIGVMMLAHRGQVPQTHHYKPKLTTFHASDHIHIQTNNTHIREKALKQKGPADPMISTQSHAEKIIAYTIKTAANKRSHLAMRTLGSLESKFTCKISVYSPHLTHWLSELAQRQHPIHLETVSAEVHTPVPPPENPVLGEAETGCTHRQRQEIIAMKYVYQQCKKKPGKSGTKYKDPRTVMSDLRWKDSNPLDLCSVSQRLKK